MGKEMQRVYKFLGYTQGALVGNREWKPKNSPGYL